MPESWWGNAIFSLVPTVVLGLIFWMVLRFIIRGDRTARREYDALEAEERAKAGLPPRERPGARAAAPASTPAASTPDASGAAPDADPSGEPPRPSA
ncbi:hypothetical protein LG314_12045 [Agrococcus terreus]|uniref:hypothetical protein n=1 Tax=Agrococcus terreus TaxID=574649 RepID=UPI0038505B14